MKLYIYEHCPFCTRARMIFGLKGLAVERSVILEGDAETPTRLIGKKAVPILEREDGSHMGESLDIVRYVDAIGTPVLTTPADEALDAWVKQVWTPALKLFIPRFTKGDFAELATPEAREAYRLREEQAFGDLEALMVTTPALLLEVNAALRELVPLLEGREALGISDITLWPVLRSLSIVRGLEYPETVLGYMDRLASQSAVPLLFDQQM
ncbi:MAG TPA: glutaredoxin 2 [Pseudomonas sp.]|uniref:glutaredoxin 2 n=1 Tax=Pseudomonas sp. TaxID=306 RepID=UPI002B48DE77|nr:glutaredoxin 2 [Pseudomonas sp.]HKS14334.1 glutaredoxin 2 [Pseudomonas sp.]